MDDTELLARADLNLIEFNREAARSTRGGVVHEEDGLVFFVPGHRFPVGFTGVTRTDPSVPAAEVSRRARAFFEPRGQGWTFCLMLHRDGDLVAQLEGEGLSRFGNSPGMALDAPQAEKPLPAGVTIERVRGEGAARDFAEVAGAAYATMGMPSKIALRQFADHRYFEQPHVAAVVARVAGTASAAAMVVVTHGVAGVYWVGTTPEARGRGLAEACTRRVANEGFAMGAEVAALQASVMGEPVYRRMGWRETTRYPWYVCMP